MADGDKIYQISADLAPGSAFSASIDPSGNLNLRREQQRSLYDRLLMGKALSSELGFESVAGNLTAQPPSWVQAHTRMNQAFVIGAISSSMHEVTNLNAYLSGAGPLETSAVPASSSMYYSKENRFRNVIYKVSASDVLATQLGATYVPVSGVYLTASNSTFLSPWSIPFSIDDYGRIRDIKVWIEFIHSGSFLTRSLSEVAISLRSPNVNFGYAHPWYDSSKTLENIFSYASLASLTLPKCNFIKSSYLLWEGSRVVDPLYAHKLCSWDTDRHMRTIFSDSSANPNPRHLDPLYAKNGEIPTGGVNQLSGSSPAHLGGSPTASFVGGYYPWFADPRINGLNNSSGGSTSPPPGWLTGPGGTAAVNEFATTGSNNGLKDIRPIYPLLDDIFVKPPWPWESGSYNTLLTGFEEIEEIYKNTVMRPGLRGTEVHGVWKLMFGLEQPVFFRQARLEFIIDQRAGNEIRQRLFDRGGPVYKPNRLIRRAILTCSLGARSDFVPLGPLVYVYDKAIEEYGRTVGITDDTGSFADFSVFTRITGTLSEYLTGSTHAGARHAFLHNEFGTPYIPLSSGSGLQPQSQTVVEFDDSRATVSDVLNPKTLIPSKNTLQSLLSSGEYSKSTSRRMIEKIEELDLLNTSGSV